MAIRIARRSTEFWRMKLQFQVLCMAWALMNIPLAAQKTSTEEYIRTYSATAIREMEAWQIPASITLAQGILESASGNSPLAREANNHFGIKCKKDWAGETYFYDDDAKQECFRKYPNALASYEDHSAFLKNGSRYAFLFQLERTDYQGWAHGLKQAGYATNPKYAPLLIKTIEDYQLQRFDKPGKAAQYEAPKSAKPKPETEVHQGRKGSGSEDLPDFELKKGRGRPVKTHNGVPYVLAQKGDNLKSLSRELEMMPWQLPKYNDLAETTELKSGTRVYLHPKRRKGDVAEHVVQSGESLWDISQQHGIKLKRLCVLNGLEPDARLKSGQKLRLR